MIPRKPWWRRVLGWVGIVVIAFGCQHERPEWSLMKAKVVGSGCSAWGCVATLIVTTGGRKGQHCTLNGTALNVGDTLLIEGDGEYCKIH